MTTAIRSEATRTVVAVNGVDVLSVKPDGQLEILTTTGLTDTHIPLMKQFASIETNGGTSYTQLNIPSWAKKITITLFNISTNGSALPLIRLGTASGIDTTGYLGATIINGSPINSASGAALVNANAAGILVHGVITACLVGGTTWSLGGAVGRSDAAAAGALGYSKTLVAPLDRIQLTTSNGTDLFDAGNLTVLVEG